MRALQKPLGFSRPVTANPVKAFLVPNGLEHEMPAIGRPYWYRRVTGEREPTGRVPFKVVNVNIRPIAGERQLPPIRRQARVRIVARRSNQRPHLARTIQPRHLPWLGRPLARHIDGGSRHRKINLASAGDGVGGHIVQQGNGGPMHFQALRVEPHPKQHPLVDVHQVPAGEGTGRSIRRAARS